MISNGWIRQPEDQLPAWWARRQLPLALPQKPVTLMPVPFGPPQPSIAMEQLKAAMTRP